MLYIIKKYCTILLAWVILLGTITFPLTAVMLYDEDSYVRCPTGLTIEEYAKCKVEERFGNGHWESFNNIIKRESHWNYLAKNPTSSARGLCQTMMSYYSHEVDSDFLTNPYKQINWCIDYTVDRYGNPNKAWNFWLSNKYW